MSDRLGAPSARRWFADLLGEHALAGGAAPGAGDGGRGKDGKKKKGESADAANALNTRYSVDAYEKL